MLLPVLTVIADEGLIGNWSPGIGDPSVVGWVTVAAYLATAWCCRLAALRIRASGSTLPAAGRERLLWDVLAGAFLLLGINKQLDLQTALTEIGRKLARRQHWYEERREVQFVFVLAVATIGVVTAIAAARAARGASSAARLAVAGAILVATFVVLRAASFHHVDLFLQARWLGVKANWALELSGIGVVFGATRLHRRQPPTTDPT